MVTLAFAQAASIIVLRNPGGLTGGEEGKALPRAGVPDLFVGVANAPYRYWLALGFVVIAWCAVTWLIRSRAGHAMAAVRENEPRAAVLGHRHLPHQAPRRGRRGVRRRPRRRRPRRRARRAPTRTSPLRSSPCRCWSWWCSAAPEPVGRGARGVPLHVCGRAPRRAVGDLRVLRHCPKVCVLVLSQPLFILGLLFIIVVYFAPAGLTGLARGDGCSSGRRRHRERHAGRQRAGVPAGSASSCPRGASTSTTSASATPGPKRPSSSRSTGSRRTG